MKRFIKSLLPVGVGLAMLMAAIAAAPSPARAQSINIIGFSKNGKYLAVSRWSSTNTRLFVKLRILNVPKNSFVSRSVSRSTKGPRPEDYDTTGMMLQELEMNTVKKGRSLMERFKIDYETPGYASGKYGGYEPEFWQAPRSKNWKKIILESKNSGVYNLNLETRNSPGGKKCGGGKPTKIFTLTLTKDKGASKILQKDKKLYGSRKCPFDYKISQVVLYKNFIVVIIRSKIPPKYATRDLIVTGTMN